MNSAAVTFNLEKRTITKWKAVVNKVLHPLAQKSFGKIMASEASISNITLKKLESGFVIDNGKKQKKLEDTVVEKILDQAGVTEIKVSQGTAYKDLNKMLKLLRLANPFKSEQFLYRLGVASLFESKEGKINLNGLCSPWDLFYVDNEPKPRLFGPDNFDMIEFPLFPMLRTSFRHPKLAVYLTPIGGLVGNWIKDGDLKGLVWGAVIGLTLGLFIRPFFGVELDLQFIDEDHEHLSQPKLWKKYEQERRNQFNNGPEEIKIAAGIAMDPSAEPELIADSLCKIAAWDAASNSTTQGKGHPNFKRVEEILFFPRALKNQEEIQNFIVKKDPELFRAIVKEHYADVVDFFAGRDGMNLRKNNQ